MSDRPDEYAGIADVYDAWCLEVEEDIPFYVGMAVGAETRIVELAAGSGRITIPLAQAGWDVVAIDRSPAMLERLAVAAATAGVAGRIDVRLGDLRAPGLTGTYDRVLIPFRSLLHLRNDAERIEALSAARALLAPGGYLAFDVFAPTPADIRATQGVWYRRDSGARERADWNRADGTTLIEVEMRGRSTTLRLHPAPAAHWLDLVVQAGLEVITAWGDFDGAPVRADGAGDLVVVAA